MSTAELSFLTVEIAGQLVALSVDAVQAVLPMNEIVPVPLAPAPVAGVTTKRGHVLTVIDARRVVSPDAMTAAGEGVVVDVQGYRYALLVDAVGEVVSIGANGIQPPPPGVSPIWSRFVTSMIHMDADHYALIVQIEHFVEIREPAERAVNQPITSMALETAAVH